MTIKSRLPQRVGNGYKYVQGRLPKDLVERVRNQMRRDGINWDQLLQASFETYLDESLKEENIKPDADSSGRKFIPRNT